ncbi:unnamed protein product [Strongylus vulgaris]|uniref:Uncharacterized protein n=1 Tax=Strongylus vulgaris TaxID=40348 RepID=A0A3P7LV33_STRVU|nr:unnamed protein product [Strongylus vulgaris]
MVSCIGVSASDERTDGRTDGWPHSKRPGGTVVDAVWAAASGHRRPLRKCWLTCPISAASSPQIAVVCIADWSSVVVATFTFGRSGEREMWLNAAVKLKGT